MTHPSMKDSVQKRKTPLSLKIDLNLNDAKSTTTAHFQPFQKVGTLQGINSLPMQDLPSGCGMFKAHTESSLVRQNPLVPLTTY